MDRGNKKTRREFLGDVLRKGSLVAIGGIVALELPREARGVSREYKKTLSSMAQIDPKMILYREMSGPVPTGFTESRNVAIDGSGILYVVGDQAIRIFNPQGRIKETIDLTISPFCLAPTDEQFYIGTRDRIVIADREGKVLSTWPSLDNIIYICPQF